MIRLVLNEMEIGLDKIKCHSSWSLKGIQRLETQRHKGHRGKAKREGERSSRLCALCCLRVSKRILQEYLTA